MTTTKLKVKTFVDSKAQAWRVGQIVHLKGAQVNCRIVGFQREKTSGAVFANLTGDLTSAMEPKLTGTAYALEQVEPALTPEELAAIAADHQARTVVYQLQRTEAAVISRLQSIKEDLRQIAARIEREMMPIVNKVRWCPSCLKYREEGAYGEEEHHPCKTCGLSTEPSMTDEQRRARLLFASREVQHAVLWGLANLGLDRLTGDAIDLANAGGRNGELSR